MSAAPARAPARAKRRPGSAAPAFYRLSRTLHAYLSAFAFLALIFFSVTGLTLNHPDWFAGRRPAEAVRTVRVPMDQIAAAQGAAEPERALAEAVGRLTPLAGAFSSGEILDGEALIRLEGPGGVSDVTVDLATGEAEAAVRKAGLVAMLNDLHKGKAAGAAWRTAIDVCAIVFLVLSILGYVLFFSLRYRLKPSLILTAAGLAALAAVAALALA